MSKAIGSGLAGGPSVSRLIAGALCVLAALLALRIGMRTKRQGHMAAATA